MDGVSQEGFQTLEDMQQPVQAVQETLFSLTELTVKTTVTLDDLKKQLKVAKEMISDALKNNADYHHQAEQVKVVENQRNAVKENLLRTPELSQLVHKAKEIQSDIKDKKMAQSDYALEYSRLSGSNEIQLPDGTIYNIVKVAKLVKHTQ
jgi:hypothetical protein